MKKQSAGILLYRKRETGVQVLLVHPGGPYWVNKDEGAWSIPKGLFESDEEPFAAAKREFGEEIGQAPPAGEYHELGFFHRRDGKTIYAWAVEGDLDAEQIHSNTFQLEWPPNSGQIQEFPECDKAKWFNLGEAAIKLSQGQSEFLERLAQHLGVPTT